MRRTLNLIKIAQKKILHVAVVTLDAEKAFDKVLWPYLFETLNRFGIHDRFIRWLKAMYKEPKSLIYFDPSK